MASRIRCRRSSCATSSYLLGNGEPDRPSAWATRCTDRPAAALIIELEQASRTAAKTQRPQLLPLLAHTYQAAAAMLVKVGDRGAPDGSPRIAPSLQPNEAAILR